MEEEPLHGDYRGRITDGSCLQKPRYFAELNYSYVNVFPLFRKAVNTTRITRIYASTEQMNMFGTPPWTQIK